MLVRLMSRRVGLVGSTSLVCRSLSVVAATHLAPKPTFRNWPRLHYLDLPNSNHVYTTQTPCCQIVLSKHAAVSFIGRDDHTMVPGCGMWAGHLTDKLSHCRTM